MIKFNACMSIVAMVINILAGNIFAAPARFDIQPGGENHVEFLSRAPLETIKGVTDRVNGFIEVDLENPGNGAEARIEVDMASLDTGNITRNRHMRENHLATDQFPKGYFVLESIFKPSMVEIKFEDKTTFQVTGELTLRGTTRMITADVISEISNNRDILYITAKFFVPLSDFNIPHPKFLISKLSDVHEITVKLVAKK